MRFFVLVSLVVAVSGATIAADPAAKPNILMIAVDDLNDWVEPLGGHPQSQTPAIAALARRGVNFTNAHCQSPLCNSSRTSLMMSLRPGTTGVYGLGPLPKDVASLRDVESLPRRLRAAGYETYQTGKIYHSPTANGKDEFDHHGVFPVVGKTPDKKLVPPTPGGDHRLMDWGVFDHQESEKGDYQVAQWSVEQLDHMPTDKPFFMACGIFMPHVPCYSTPAWWEKFDHAALQMPAIRADDRLDCSPFSWYLHWDLPEPRLSWLNDKDQHRNLVHAYLASIAWADHCAGRILDALAKSPHKDNTIVVLWSDHGWHLGEKNITGKNTLWEPSTRVPLLFAGPGIASGTCRSPAELLDIYPTLCELIGETIPAHVEGQSLMPQLQNPNVIRSHPAITDHNAGNQGIRDERYRYIHYADGSEELYDIQSDPNEFDNIIGDEKHAAARTRLRGFVRSDMAPLAAGSHSRILELRDDGWYWEDRKIDQDHPPLNIAPNVPSDLPRGKLN